MLPQLDHQYNDEFPKIGEESKQNAQLDRIEEEMPGKFMNLGAPKVANGDVIALPAAGEEQQK